MFGEITALSQKNGYCYASNNYFSRIYNVDPSTVSKWVKGLSDNGYISVNYDRKGKEIKSRRLKPLMDKGGSEINQGGIEKSQGGVLKKSQGGIEKTAKYNNTSNNNTSSNNVPALSETEHDALEVCEHLLSAITDSDPDHRYNSNPPDIKTTSWLTEVDRAIRLDGRSKDDLMHLISILFYDNNNVSQFWRPNVESGKKLRSQFDKIRGQLQRLPKFKQNNHDQFVDQLFA